jgi:demethylmenaquinone methyltransferase/2-methoxy-6-polyprenyl-1,4-benzoquinol methylase
MTTAHTPPGTPLPQGDDKAVAVRAMFDRIAPRYDLINRLLTFRLDVRWRRRTVDALGLRPGAVVVDLACGTGDFCRELSSAGLRPIGVDVSWGMLDHARTTAPLLHTDALRLPLRDCSVEGITCGFALRNVVDLGAFAAECARVLRPGGRVALLEVAEPENPVLRAGHQLYFGRIVPWVGGKLSDPAAYRYLPKSVAYLPPPAELSDLFVQAGLGPLRRTLLAPGAAQLLVTTKPLPATQPQPAA